MTDSYKNIRCALALSLLNHSVAMVAAIDKQSELRLLFWETTAGCNLECIHCRRLDVSKQLMKTDLSTQEALVFVRNLAEFAQTDSGSFRR